MAENVIKADNLSFTYSESTEGITDVNFNIEEGNVVLRQHDDAFPAEQLEVVARVELADDYVGLPILREAHHLFEAVLPLEGRRHAAHFPPLSRFTGIP